MRRIPAFLLCALLLFSVSVHAAEVPEGLGVLTLQAAGGTITLQNDRDYPVFVYAGGEPADGRLRLSVRHKGRTAVVFEGDGAALQAGRVLLCTLQDGGTAEISAEGTALSGALTLSAVRADTAGETDHARLIFYVCIWMALVIFGSYLALVFSGRHRKKIKKD